MDNTLTLRPKFGRVPAAMIAALAALGVVSLFVSGEVAQLRFLPLMILIGFAAWLTYWRPSVSLSPAGVVFVNLLRTRRITWPAIQRIDTKYALAIYANGTKITAWAAPAPGRFAGTRVSKRDVTGLPESTYSAEGRVGLGDLPTSDSGIAAIAVRRQWEEFRDAGLLGEPDGTGVVTTWHTLSTIALVVLVAATVVGLIL